MKKKEKLKGPINLGASGSGCGCHDSSDPVEIVQREISVKNISGQTMRPVVTCTFQGTGFSNGCKTSTYNCIAEGSGNGYIVTVFTCPGGTHAVTTPVPKFV